MIITVETHKLPDGRYQAVASLRNPKVLRGGVPLTIRESVCVRHSQAAAEAVARLDVMMEGYLLPTTPKPQEIQETECDSLMGYCIRTLLSLIYAKSGVI